MYLPGYDFDFELPPQNPRGGVGIYYKQNIQNVEIRRDLSYNKTCTCDMCQTESLVLRFTLAEVKYTVCGIYRHPNGNTDHFINDLNAFCQGLPANEVLIIAGDMNIDLIKYEDNAVLGFLTTLMSYSFIPLVTLPTRITYHSATCIDHIFIKTGQNFDIHPGITHADISDHLPTFIMIDCKIQMVKRKRPMVRIFSDKNCAQFRDKINKINWNTELANNSNPYSIFNNRILELYNKCFPLKQLSRKRQKDKPWITKGLKISIKQKKSTLS